MKIFFALLLVLVFNTTNSFGFGRKPKPAPLPHDEVDNELRLVKPEINDSISSAKLKCAKLSQDSRADTLIIGFEGLDGFDPSMIWLSYRYHWRTTHNLPAERPTLNLLSPINHRLLMPIGENLKEQIEYLDFPENSIQSNKNSNAEVCALAWMNKKYRNRKLVLMGHSFGAYAALLLSDNLKRKDIWVDQVYSVDPRPRLFGRSFQKPSSVRLWNNYFQKNTTFMNGYWVAGANLNLNLSHLGVKHGSIVRSPVILETILNELEDR